MNFIKNLVNYTRTCVIFTAVAAILSASVTHASTEDETEFLKSAFSAKTETIQQLLEKGFNVDYQNDMGFSALIIASQ